MHSMEYIKKLSVPVLIAATIVSAILQAIAQAVLNTFYERSGYPVPYYVGQTSFDAAKLEGWYATMRSAGTLDVYWQTQFVDFAFIAATALLHLALLALVARLLPAGAWRRTAVALLVVGLLAPAFDVLENLASFVALANPTDISPIVAVVYSSFAALKFLCFFAVYLWVPVALVAALVFRARATRRVTQPAR